MRAVGENARREAKAAAGDNDGQQRPERQRGKAGNKVVRMLHPSHDADPIGDNRGKQTGKNGAVVHPSDSQDLEPE